MAELRQQVALPGLLGQENSNSQTSEQEPSTSVCEMEDSLPQLKQKNKVKNEKFCGVCGDKALGFNFNAITCESCKAFFRRNAFKDKSIKCLFDNSCIVDLRTRRFCPACRIKKCFMIGMNRDMILDDQERKKRQKKISATGLKTKSTIPEETPFLVAVKSEPSLDQTDVPTSSSIECPNLYTPLPLARMHGDKTDVFFKHPPTDELPEDETMYAKLDERESEILKNITNAYRSTMASSPVEKSDSRYDNVVDLINCSELVVKKLIMFVKYLEDFKNLSQEDQVSCLKTCVLNSILLRSALYYNVENDAWLTDKDQCIPTSILKSATGFVTLHNQHVNFCRKVKTMVEDDLNLFSLMQVLIVFDPTGQNISNRKFVSSVQDQYFILLKHYLESCHSYKFAKEYFLGTLECLCDLKLLSDEHAKILLQVNPLDVEPLMLEIMNLK